MTWRDKANCRGMSIDAFFPPVEYDNDSQLTGPARQIFAAARQVCAGCEVRDECLTEALDRRERFGMFGGLAPHERRRLLRERRSA